MSIDSLDSYISRNVNLTLKIYSPENNIPQKYPSLPQFKKILLLSLV